MAPEIILGKGYSYHVDLWSVGICCYEFMCGGLPYAEELDVFIWWKCRIPMKYMKKSWILNWNSPISLETDRLNVILINYFLNNLKQD